MDNKPPEKCYRFHPVTGIDANDLTVVGNPEQREEIADMVRAGARFYWHKEPITGGEWGRIERANYAFVKNMMGEPVEWIEEKQGENS